MGPLCWEQRIRARRPRCPQFPRTSKRRLYQRCVESGSGLRPTANKRNPDTQSVAGSARYGVTNAPRSIRSHLHSRSTAKRFPAAREVFSASAFVLFLEISRPRTSAARMGLTQAAFQPREKLKLPLPPPRERSHRSRRQGGISGIRAERDPHRPHLDPVSIANRSPPTRLERAAVHPRSILAVQIFDVEDAILGKEP